MSLSADAFAFVRDHVRAESAIVLDAGKVYLVDSRLMPLARACGHADVTEFVRHVQRTRDPVLLRRVVEALTTNETSFYRDNDPFVALRQDVLPALAARRPQRRLRIWTAACSTGQEPYSVAMAVRETPAIQRFYVDILGTDLSEEVLERARRAEYSQLEVNRGLPATTLVRHFQRSGASWKLNPEIASMVKFSRLNLTRPFGPIGQFDVVFLRNVLIYFDVETKRDVLRRVRQVMAPDGYLFLGAAEMTMGVDDSWERVPAGRSSVYRIREDAAALAR
ncbi:CheR family methyltransferase [Nocardioides jishulii]|uniref:protein-glutamate O-methyltransferase n=1 Tax=Nocardioides jishulii TaxID=2575440 RepID=A0A4V5TKP9_9ACTN|nr:protein-glutamate O-methyltransferase CheR [Nocardioides jishulii]QCX28564.1 protein-glutamate O-methyltransferase CheR [Nocardioides jishulii]TKI64543.1 protein-glutamate O-methyltransferase CheR [Nocardioides jishulii]